MSNVADRLSKFLENAFKKAFSMSEDSSNLNLKEDQKFVHVDTFQYDTIEDYKNAGHNFRRTKDQMDRRLSREEAFKEFKKSKNK